MSQQSTDTVTYRLYYGGTLLGTVAFGGTSTINGTGMIEATVVGNGATNAQVGAITCWEGNSSIAGSSIGAAAGTSSIDSTVRQLLSITVQPSVSNANTRCILNHYITERIS